MGWETRERGGRYYYRKERDGSRVRSIYVGAGLFGQSAAMLSRLEREKREAESAAIRREIEKQEAVDARIDEICELIEKLVTMALIASGYHQHKRQWRRTRDEKDEPKVS
jgi:hypothetical protein